MSNKVKAMVDDDAACDLCEQPLKRGEHFYDCATRRGWGWLCKQCFTAGGYSLGTGRGQEYDSKTNEKTNG